MRRIEARMSSIDGSASAGGAGAGAGFGGALLREKTPLID
jgi:hypothetical protein